MNVHMAKEPTSVDAYIKEFAEPVGYLDFARFGPISAAVAAQKVHDATLTHIHGAAALAELDALTVTAKASAAQLLRASPGEVAFVSSTSHGLFAAAQSLSPQTGTILVPRGDFPSNIYPWIRAAERGGLQVRWLDREVSSDTVRAALDSTVKAVAVSAIDAGTGAKAPLADIKELIGPDRVLVVDAVQALGAVDFDLDAADILSAGGQKWLRAGWGAAMLLVRDRVADRLQPGLGGWTGVVDPLDSAPHPHPTLPGAITHTLTNPDGTAVAALGVAIDLVLAAGVRRISDKISENLARLLDIAAESGADVLNPSPPGGIGCFRIPGHDNAELHQQLELAGLSTTRRGPWIRISPHASTTPHTVDVLANTLSLLQNSSLQPGLTGNFAH